jgi:hypothetical protein
MEWVEVYPAVWDKVLTMFGWSPEQMRADERLAFLKECAKDEDDLIYHELPLNWIAHWLIPPDVRDVAPKADHNHLAREIEEALECPGQPGAYLDDPDFDWDAAMRRVETLFAAWRKRYGVIDSSFPHRPQRS